MTLGQLIEPLDAGELFDGFASVTGRQLSVDELRCASLLSWNAIDDLVNHPSIASNHFGVMLRGHPVSAQMYSLPAGGVDVALLRPFLAMGATIVMTGIEEYVPAIFELTRSCERRGGLPASAACHVCFGMAGAAPRSALTHSTLTIQLHGSHTWQIEENGHVRLTAMRPGDLLYSPRGTWRETAATTAPSVWLSIEFRHITASDVFAGLAASASRDPLLRRDIVSSADPHARGATIEAIRERVHHLIDQVDIERVIAERPLRSAITLALDQRLDPRSRLVPVSGDPRRTIQIADRLSHIANATTALQLAQEHDGITLQELADALHSTNDDAFREMIRAVVDSGCCTLRQP